MGVLPLTVQQLGPVRCADGVRPLPRLGVPGAKGATPRQLLQPVTPGHHAPAAPEQPDIPACPE